MINKENIKPYTHESLNRQKTLLKNELENLGINISQEEAARISFLSRRKYERYDLFRPGESFDNRLITWLERNFEKSDRQTALEIIKCLKFISEYEVKELAIQTFENAKKIILSEMTGISNYNCYSFLETRNIKFNEELNNSIFVACVDDVEYDFFRRYAMGQNINIFQKENFVEYYKIYKDSLNELPEHTRIFLIDQLSGSGTTALRYMQKEREWRGKIPTFFKIWREVINNDKIYYCPYILSQHSKNNIEKRRKQYIDEFPSNDFDIYPTCIFPISPCLSNKIGSDIDDTKPVAKLCNKYYDYFEPDKHIEEGGSAVYGFGRAGLTLILQSNCPNNTIPVIWHDYNDWFPLFPRISHHQEIKG